MANKFVNGLDVQIWRPYPRSLNNAHAAWISLCADKRSDISRNPYIYQLVSNAVLNRVNFVQKWVQFAVNPGLGGTFGAWATCDFAPSRALEWAIAAGSTTSKINTSTVMTTVALNQLANRGGTGDYGFKIRIIGKSAGKVEERFIVANTAGTTPTLWLNNPLTFTPTTADTYEILWGAVYMLGAGVIAATSFRSYEIAANALTSLSNTNLPGTISTDSYMTVLDEAYTPYDNEPGCGFIKGTFVYDSNYTDRYALAATAAGASSLTGQATLGDSVIIANEYRNFQIRVVQDTLNPTAVGQRRIIASHTAGPSPVYTLWSAWTVTPSATAKFVIEYPNLILLRSTATTSLYVYNYNKENITNGTNTINANAWSVTYFGTASAAAGAGCMIMPSFWIQPDVGRNARHSFIYFVRWGGSASIDLLDISWAIAWTWTADIPYDGKWTTITTGSCGDYAPNDNEWKFFYMNAFVASQNHQSYRFDVKNRVFTPHVPTSQIQSGTAAVGNRMATQTILKRNDVDPDIIDEKFTVVMLQMHLSSDAYELITQV